MIRGFGSPMILLSMARSAIFRNIGLIAEKIQTRIFRFTSLYVCWIMSTQGGSSTGKIPICTYWRIYVDNLIRCHSQNGEKVVPLHMKYHWETSHNLLEQCKL